MRSVIQGCAALRGTLQLCSINNTAEAMQNSLLAGNCETVLTSVMCFAGA